MHMRGEKGEKKDEKKISKSHGLVVGGIDGSDLHTNRRMGRRSEYAE